MEIDLLSPQMRMRTASNKRARSPDSPSPLERVPKRALIITHEPVPQLAWNSGVSSTRSPGAGMRRCFHDDEMVHQTRELSLHSPALGNGEQVPRVGDESLGYGTREDVQMVRAERRGDHQRAVTHHFLQNEDNYCPMFTSQINAQEHNTPPIPALHKPEVEISTMATSTPRHQHHCQYPTSRPSAQDLVIPPQAEEKSQTLQQLEPHSAPPQIALHPATPLTHSEGVPFVPTSPSTPALDHVPSSPMSMDNYPSSPSSPSTWRNGVQKKRHLVSMGPRGDCEKCRLKVPGHWMHFD
ncbi:hypothetical protein DFH11DRAFT_1505119 [Phellopilus nigrolimitatus]|nr:hypothetical protein DFH11DRAFT_1505119 [Phellopilus nigrolimitatus]